MCDCISYNRPEAYQKTPSPILVPPEELALGKDTICVDACIVDQVEALWAAGVATLSTCCGHNGQFDRHVVVVPEHAVQAKSVLAGFADPLGVYCWRLVAA
jgi:hypothetical protein